MIDENGHGRRWKKGEISVNVWLKDEEEEEEEMCK